MHNPILMFLLDREDGVSIQELHAMAKGDMRVLGEFAYMCQEPEDKRILEPLEKKGIIRWRVKKTYK